MQYRLILLSFLFLAIGCVEKQKEVSEKNIQKKAYLTETQQINDSISKNIASVNFRNHPYQSSEKLKLIEAEVQHARATNTLDPQLVIEYAKALLDAGNSQKAINTFEELLTKLPKNKVITKTTKTLHEALAIGYMRLGEQTNCIENHSLESCLFPIKGKGVHTNKEGSQKAIKIYESILKVFPDDLQSKWLLNLAYMTLGEYPTNVPAHLLLNPKLFTQNMIKLQHSIIFQCI